MNELQIFQTVSNETTKQKNGYEFTISTVCDESGEFEIVISGNGGIANAKSAVERVGEIVGKTRI